jgi:4-amino-4-deoxy-L-arabinose transferase-like glycosyltransferase
MTAVSELHQPTRRRIGAVGWTLALVVVALGGYERWWMSAHTIGTLTSDGAVVGLMALHLIHHGQFPAYMWGQSYGGSLEMLETAIVFVVAGIGTGQLLATTALTSFLAAFALWRAARRLVGEPAALLAALALWVWPVLFTWRSLKPGGTYIVGLALAWCAIGYLIRLKQGERTTYVLVGAGVLCGLSFWSSPMTLQLLFPALLWSYGELRALGRRFTLVLGGAVLGAMPAIVYGVTHAFANLVAPNSNHVYVGLVTRFEQFFTIELPIAASLRVEGYRQWVGGPFGPIATVVLIAALVAVGVAVLRRRAPRCELPMLALGLLPILYALNTLASNEGQGRYVLLGSTMGMLLVGVGVDNAARWLGHAARGRARTRLRPVATWAIALGLLATLGVVAMNEQPGAKLAEFPVNGVPMPPTDRALRALLRADHVHDAFASYWMAYRVTFETDEAVAVTPTSLGRYPPIRDAVDSSSDPAYLFLTASPVLDSFERWLKAGNKAFEVTSRGVFSVVQPAVKLLPNMIPGSIIPKLVGAK